MKIFTNKTASPFYSLGKELQTTKKKTASQSPFLRVKAGSWAFTKATIITKKIYLCSFPPNIVAIYTKFY